MQPGQSIALPESDVFGGQGLIPAEPNMANDSGTSGKAIFQVIPACPSTPPPNTSLSIASNRIGELPLDRPLPWAL